MKRLDECLNNVYGSYILPFFWQHGDSHEVLLEEMKAIKESGAKEFCVESRIHNDFCKDKWWEDFGFILEEAKKLEMGVWLLDDKCFPTGFANGALANHKDLVKKHLRIEFTDIVGPRMSSALIVPDIDKGNEKLINVVAYKRSADCVSLEGEPLGLMDRVNDGLVFLDIPEGNFRVFFVIETRIGSARYGLIDMLNPASCRLQLEYVYEPHYEHFKEYFGNVFKGFFSDEPCFGNEAGYIDSRLGKEGMLLPVSDELIEMLSQRLHRSREYILDVVPILWQKHEQIMHELRLNYMDAVSLLYKRNFSDMLGDWCRSRGVMYIGHIIEDNNLHMMLGAGVGHFFRALSGQDMSGCDIVLNQMVPGFNDYTSSAPIAGKIANPEFFRYTLAKLCVSDAHLDIKKKGRAMCEIFGAFGWAEGVPMMKQLADHMLVSGINHFVPHAFTNRFPNPDCPPHFYCGGKYTQFDKFCKLTKYMQRVSHLFYGGKHVNHVAVLYNCEADWCCGDYDLFQKVSKILLQNQIDFDFVPSDYLENPCFVDNGFEICGEVFKTIVVSHSSVLPKELVDKLNKLSENGIDVIYCEHLPCKYADSNEAVNCGNCTVVKYSDLPKSLEKYRDIRLSKEHKYLRFYHVKNDGKDVYMFSNEDIFNEICVDVILSHSGEYVNYNAWDNTVLYGKTNENVFNLRLKPSSSCVIIFDEHGKEVTDIYKNYTKEEINPTWSISVENDGEFVHFDTTERLCNLAPKMPKYCGKIRYCAKIKLDKIPEKITLGNVGEIATLFINGKECGDALFSPFEFDVYDYLNLGENEIVVEVHTNFGYSQRDSLSRYLSLPPMGLIGPIHLHYN